MKIRLGPLPVYFEMNGLMLAGVLVGLAGLGFWVAGAAGAYDPAAPLGEGEGRIARLRMADLAIGVGLVGIALYFLGRVVQIVMALRSRR